MNECLALTRTASVGEVLMCGLELAVGSRLLLGLLVFAICVYAMYKMRMPTLVSLPLGIFLLYIFAGAGPGGLPVHELFRYWMWFVLIVFPVLLVLMLWRLRR